MRTDRWATIPSIGVALLPKLSCPFCWPAYAAIANMLGLGFLIDSRYLLLTTAGFLLLAIAALLYRARHRHGYLPAVLGLASSALIVLGKFVLGSRVTFYAGLAMVMAASVWNAWPRKQRSCCSLGPVKP